MPLLLFTSDGSDATADFTSKIDSTYKEYLFIFNNIHPETDEVQFQFNASIDSGSNYNVASTSTFIYSYHDEADSGTALAYEATKDLAQGTGFETLSWDTGNGNDECCSGWLRLFNPSSTTFVKHFIASTNDYHSENYSIVGHKAGYFNTTSAVDAVQFKFDSGEIQGGTIGMFGVI